VVQLVSRYFCVADRLPEVIYIDDISLNKMFILRGFYDRCKGWYLMRVFTLICGVFTCKYPFKMAFGKY